MKFSALFSIALSVLPLLVRANTPLSDEVVQASMSNNHGFDIAFASRPMWHFGQSRGNKPCYPSSALVDGQQHGTNPDVFPKAGTGCADPGLIGGEGNPFPTYYTVSYCGTDELRVVYNLYYSHDGFSNVLIAKGHMHDWERIIVIWQRSNGQWTRKQLLKSFHSGYMEDNWATIQNTINYDNLDEQNGKDKDGAKIYCGWAKHANFDDRNTGWNDPASQGCEREFRSRDWWYLPDETTLIAAGSGSDEGEKMKAFDWGSATGTPWNWESKVCDAKEGGYTAC